MDQKLSEKITGETAFVNLKNDEQELLYYFKCKSQILVYSTTNNIDNKTIIVLVNKIIEIKEINDYNVKQEKADESLESFCKGYPPQDEKISIMYKISQGINQLHENKIIHNNIKLENFLMIGKDLKVGGLTKAEQIIQQTGLRDSRAYFDSLMAKEVQQLGHLFFLIQTRQNLVNDYVNYDEFQLEELQIIQIEKEKKELSINQEGIDLLDLIKKMIQCNQYKRITLPEILEWFHSKNEEEITQKAQQKQHGKISLNYDFHSYDCQTKKVKI